MKVVFRTDASSEIGAGHVMRCLTLASALNRQNCSVSFICQDLPGELSSYIEESGYSVRLMPPVSRRLPDTADSPGTESELLDARETSSALLDEQGEVDWLVVDHYGLGATWETQMNSRADHLLVIDDLADRPHRCDLLVDDNLVANYKRRYDTLVPRACTRLLGPEFSLIRPEFKQNENGPKKHDREVKNVLITMGGSDPQNIANWLLDAILNSDLTDVLSITVVVGPSFLNSEETASIAKSSRHHQVQVRRNVKNMAELMRNSDLAISAGGQTCYELILCRVPTLILASNTTQNAFSQELDRIGVVQYLGAFSAVSAPAFLRSFTCLIEDESKRDRMIRSGRNLIDTGGAQRIVEHMVRKAGLEPPLAGTSP